MQPHPQESKADYKMKQAMTQLQISLAQSRRHRAWSRCCDKLGKRMVTAMRPASGWPSVRTPYSRESLRRKQRKLAQCREPLLMLETEQRLRKLTSMRWDDVKRGVQVMWRAGVVKKTVALAVIV